MASARQKLEAFNVALCAESGAGKGCETTLEALARYYTLLSARRDECLSLIQAVERESEESLFAYGMRCALARAAAASPTPKES